MTTTDDHHRALTVGLVLTVTLVGFETLAVSTALPSISQDLHGVALYGWVGSAYMLGNLLGIVYAGRAADRRGPAPPFLLGLTLFAAGLALGSFAPSMGVLVAARLVQGLGGGAIPAIAYVAVGRAYPAEMQPRVFAIMSSAWVIPGVVAPAISAVITASFGWRWVFAGLLPFVVPAAVLTFPALRVLGAPARADEAPSISRRAAVRVTFGVAVLLAAIDGLPVAVAVALGIVGLVVATRAYLVLTPRGTLRAARGLPATIAVRGLQTFGFFGADFFVSRLVRDARGGSYTLLVVAVGAGTLAWTGAAWIAARQLGRVGARPLVRTGFAVIAVGNALLIVAALHDAPLALVVVAPTITGFGMGLGYSPVSVTMLSQAEAGREGAASAALSLTDVLGFAVGTGIGGAFVHLADAQGWTVGRGVQLAFALPLAVALVGLWVGRRLPAPKTAPEHASHGHVGRADATHVRVDGQAVGS
jgi:MFS family permease